MNIHRGGPLVLPFVLLSFAALSCSDNANDEQVAQGSRVGGTTPLVDLRVEAPTEALTGEKVNLNLVVTNSTTSAIQVSSSLPEYRYEFVVTDGNDNEVWNSLFARAIPDILEPWTVAPSSDVVYQGTWPTLDNGGSAVAPGDYFITGKLVTESPNGWVTEPESPPVPITILPAE